MADCFQVLMELEKGVWVISIVLIMKMLDHPNIVNLIEYLNILGKWLFEGAGPPGVLGENVARNTCVISFLD